MHKIVYLDQNYLSNLARAQQNLIKSENESEFWLSLLGYLKEAVFTDKIVIPQSEFHRIEAKYDSRREDSIVKVIDELSLGLSFLPYDCILKLQIEDAARRFLGKPTEVGELWATAFESNPHESVKSRIAGQKRHERIEYTDSKLREEITEQDRRRKLDFADEARRLIEEYGSNPLEWSDLVLASKRSFLDGFMGKTAGQSIVEQLKEDDPLSKLRAMQRYVELKDLFQRLRTIGIEVDSPKVMDFAESEELLNIPFVDINASLWASVAWYYLQGGSLGTGDYYDVPIISTTLPYCDFIATDSFMKELIVNFLNFDHTYKAKVFSAKKEDRLTFSKMIRELTNSTNQH